MNKGLRWLPANRVNTALIPPPLRECLLDTGSLTVRLARLCQGRFSLRLAGQSWRRPLPDETKVLGLRRGSYALVREIYLQCDNVPWVYGRSIIPARTCTATERRLAFWGQRSLGHYLFSGRNTWRSTMEIARVRPRDRLFQLARKNMADTATSLWARRSIFYIRHKPLLIVEIFLTDMKPCPDS